MCLLRNSDTYIKTYLKKTHYTKHKLSHLDILLHTIKQDSHIQLLKIHILITSYNENSGTQGKKTIKKKLISFQYTFPISHTTLMPHEDRNNKVNGHAKKEKIP